jgi:predicted transposase YdaD
MKESVIYQEILHEGLAEGLAKGKAQGLAKGKAQGLAKGKAQGLAKGKVQERNQIALNMLLSNIAPDVITQITGLTAKQVQALQKNAAKNSQNPKK